MTKLTNPQIRTLALLNGGYQDDKTAEWEFSDKNLMFFANAVINQTLNPGLRIIFAPTDEASAKELEELEELENIFKDQLEKPLTPEYPSLLFYSLAESDLPDAYRVLCCRADNLLAILNKFQFVGMHIDACSFDGILPIAIPKFINK